MKAIRMMPIVVAVIVLLIFLVASMVVFDYVMNLHWSIILQHNYTKIDVLKMLVGGA